MTIYYRNLCSKRWMSILLLKQISKLNYFVFVNRLNCISMTDEINYVRIIRNFTSRRSCFYSVQILVFLDISDKILLPFLLCKVLVWKICILNFWQESCRPNLVWWSKNYLVRQGSCSWFSCQIIYSCLSCPILFLATFLWFFQFIYRLFYGSKGFCLLFISVNDKLHKKQYKNLHRKYTHGSVQL